MSLGSLRLSGNNLNIRREHWPTGGINLSVDVSIR